MSAETYHKREEDGEPTEHVACCSFGVDREADIAVQDRLKVASEAVADSSARNVEGEVGRTSVVVICVGEACE